MSQHIGPLPSWIAGSPLAAVLLAADGSVAGANEAARSLLLGGGQEPPSGRSLPARLRLTEEAPIRRLLAGEVLGAVEAELTRPDGSVVPISIYGSPLGGTAPGPVSLAFLVDRTAHVHAERDGKEALARLGVVLDANPLPLVLLDRDFRVRVWNPAAEHFFGWKAEEVIGATAPFVPSDRKEENAELRRRALEKGEGVTGHETERLRKDGRRVPVASYSTALHDSGGQMTGVMLAYIDLSDRNRLEAELIEAQKMETVGRLAGGVAHDFNNLLTAIIGHAELAAAQAASPELAGFIETIRSSAGRAADLTRQLLALSSRQVLRPEVVAVHEVIAAMEPVLQPLAGDGVDLTVHLAPGLQPIQVDRRQLEQVILDLTTNALDAMPGGGRLEIRVAPVRSQAGDPDGAPGAGEWTTIAVSDTGIGMDSLTCARIFEPFFTTKEVGSGSGLGLSTVYGIVRQSGGAIRVRSLPGAGSTFTLWFPAVAGPADGPLATGVRATAKRSGKILLVEDEPVVLELARTIVARAGFDVVPAADPATALALADAPGEIALLLTDVVMPGMTGIELARRLREDRPDLPVLFMSAYSEDVIRDARSMARRFLAKPFTPGQLLAEVNAALASRG